MKFLEDLVLNIVEGNLFPSKEELLYSKKKQMSEEEVMELIVGGIVNRDFITDFSWMMPTEDNIQKLYKLLKGKKVLEINAGTGLIANRLNKLGIDITATDKSSEKFNEVAETFRIHTEGNIPVIEKDALSAMSEFDYDVILSIWPPYKDDYMHKVLEKLPRGKELVVVGEGMGGCVSNDAFWTMLESMEYDFIPIDTWPGIHDAIWRVTKE